MNKNLKFVLTSAWILFSRSYDAYCTAELTPDLSKEANPLVTILGISSWGPLLIILSVLTLYTIYAFFKSTFHSMKLSPEAKGFSFGAFVAYVYLGKKDHWSAFLFKFPKDAQRFNQYMGQVLTPCLVYAGIVSTIMWVMIHQSEWYRSFHHAAYVYSILIVGCLLIAYRWNKNLYLAYLKS